MHDDIDAEAQSNEINGTEKRIMSSIDEMTRAARGAGVRAQAARPDNREPEGNANKIYIAKEEIARLANEAMTLTEQDSETEIKIKKLRGDTASTMSAIKSPFDSLRIKIINETKEINEKIRELEAEEAKMRAVQSKWVILNFCYFNFFIFRLMIKALKPRFH